MKIQNSKFKIQNKFEILKFGFWTLFVILILLFGFSKATAQQAPELMVTWKANNYVPPDYQGKILPSVGTTVDLALELIDGSRVLDSSRAEMRWFVNGKLQKSGVGIKNFSFIANRVQQKTIVDVVLPNYKGGVVSKRVVIPVVAPEVAIDGGPNLFQALLYFFNVSNINDVQFIWSANGEEIAGAAPNPDFLNLETSNLPTGIDVFLKVTASNKSNPREISVGTANLRTR